MNKKEKELLLSGLVALLIFVALVMLFMPKRGKAPAAANGGTVLATPAVTLVTPTPTPAPTAEPRDYVLNKSSKRFHYPDCASVPEILEKNREDVFASRDELLRRGFTPCGNCKP